MNKHSQGMEDYLGTLLRTLGSERGGLMGNLSGPVAGSLLQGALLGGLGYAGSRLLKPVYPHANPKLAGILGFMLPGLLHSPLLWQNIRAGLPLNTPPSGYAPEASQ